MTTSPRNEGAQAAPVPLPPPTMALRTYSFLRIGMLGVLLGLGVSVLFEVDRSHGCVQRSVSAYYYTPTRAVFVGSLVALGVSMIVLWGKSWVEDGFLNLAGMLAPVVAFVPTSDANFCGVTNASQQAANGDPAQLINSAHQAIDNNVKTYGVIIAVALIALVLAGATSTRWADLVRNQPGPWYRDPTFCLPFGLAVALWVTGGFIFIWHRPTFYEHAHGWSATTMFAFIIIVVAASAWAKREDWRKAGSTHDATWRWMLQYAGLAVLMVVAAVVIVVAGKIAATGSWFGEHWVLVVEATLIGLFAVFWVQQTIDRRDEGAPRHNA
jgi:hypothetical protein